MLITAQEKKMKSTTTIEPLFPLVHPFPTIRCAAQTRNLRIFFEIELVIVHDFFAFGNTSIGNDDDLAVLFDLYDFGNRVRLEGEAANEQRQRRDPYLATMVDVPG